MAHVSATQEHGTWNLLHLATVNRQGLQVITTQFDAGRLVQWKSTLMSDSVELEKFRIGLTHHIGFFDLTERLYRHTYVYNLWTTCKRWA